ncbi:hypothetical protein C2L64_45085 [Paraburkholderia hospita]|uniref:Uncharacterized protein n=1 Tax=Paraburkholderia hospita TaxID=169430 RepID=A0AAN1JK32_9BURK|nr:hypothetical protein C2L64_45085 [Paraburkholderia hospita]
MRNLAEPGRPASARATGARQWATYVAVNTVQEPEPTTGLGAVGGAPLSLFTGSTRRQSS